MEREMTLPLQKNYLMGFLIWGIGLSIFVSSLAVFPLLFSGLTLPSGYSPSASPPWYFISQDFISFLSYTLGLILILLIFLLFRKRHMFFTSSMLFVEVIFYGSYLSKGISILTHTDNLFDPQLASTSWTTLAEYLNDPLKNIVFFTYIITVALTYRWMRKKYNFG